MNNKYLNGKYQYSLKQRVKIYCFCLVAIALGVISVYSDSGNGIYIAIFFLITGFFLFLTTYKNVKIYDGTLRERGLFFNRREINIDEIEGIDISQYEKIILEVKGKGKMSIFGPDLLKEKMFGYIGMKSGEEL